MDPATGQGGGEILEIDDATGTLKLLRGTKLFGTALPKAFIPGDPYDDKDQRLALFRLAESIHKGEARYPAHEAVLKREKPRIQSLPVGGRVHTIDMSEIKSQALALDSSYLFIRGHRGLEDLGRRPADRASPRTANESAWLRKAIRPSITF